VTPRAIVAPHNWLALSIFFVQSPQKICLEKMLKYLLSAIYQTGDPASHTDE
jgi:hypothetical protein